MRNEKWKMIPFPFPHFTLNSLRPEDLAILRALYRPTTRGVRHRKVADDPLMRRCSRGTIQVKVQKARLFRKVC
jgi:hypothetical protein